MRVGTYNNVCITTYSKPRFRLQQGLPLVLETVPVIGNSLGGNMASR